MISASAVTAWIRRCARITLVTLHFARGLFIAGALFPLQSTPRRKREIERWSARLLELLSVRLHVHGRPPSHGGQSLLLAANHTSWLDIFAINAVVPTRFVAKSEVRQWPLIGWLCERTGTLFIDRARRLDTARINTSVAEALREGEVVAVFPEGTTTDGSTVLKFHSSLLEPAVSAGAAVQPVAIGFVHPDGTLCTEVSYAGNKTLWDVLLAITPLPEIAAHVCFLEPTAASGRNRRELATLARDAIVWTLYREARDTRSETADDLRAATR